jgi:hypothetical protein
MARTEAGAVLTAQHRRAQMQLRARVLRDFTTLWPLWQGDQPSFARLVDATIPLVTAHHRISSALAAGYFDTFRRAEQIPGEPAPRLAGPINAEQVTASMYVTGRVMTGKAIAAGQSPQAAMQSALVRTSGAVTRHALAGGRDTLILSSLEDDRALGWARVTAGKPCAFCAMLASRGPVYREETVGFRAHDHCSCAAEPAYEGSEWPGRAREFRDLYERAQREARVAGSPSSETANPALNNFRRLIEAA